MGDNDENGLVSALNRYYDENGLKGLAYRRKQHRFTSQFIDIMMDSAEEDIPDAAIEHKSFKTKSSNKLYFSQHFSSGTEDDFLKSTHQVDRVEEFRHKTGYDVYLGVEVRRGPGKAIQLYMVPWRVVVERYNTWKDTGDCAGFTPEWLESSDKVIQVEREGGEWQIPDELVNGDLM